MEQIQNIVSAKNKVNGKTLFEHLQQLIYQIIYEPENKLKSLEQFELLSNFVKKNQFDFKEPKSDKEVNDIKLLQGEHELYINKCWKLINEFKSIKKNSALLFPSFLNQAYMLEQAGVSFSIEEAYKIQMSLKKLALENSAKEIRFWGKIIARKQDYYVAEGITPSQFSDSMPPGCELKGEGANTYTFWVTHDILGEWFELPLVTPQQIRIAREIKYIFTGDLDAEIKSYPPFPGKEKHLLKAQIVRISCATVLVPKGLYKTAEEKPREIEFEEEALKLPEYGELKNLDNWIHLHPCLLNLGRCTHWADPTLNEEDKQKVLDQLAEKDPEVERLKGITEEKSPFFKEGEENPDDQSNWKARDYGDSQQFNQIGKEEGTVGVYGTVAIRNLTWPGAMLVTNTKGWCNIYIGYGLKINQNPFNPVQPDDIQNEQQDGDEFPEPNPKNPPPVQNEADKEKQEGEGEQQEEEAQ